MGPTNGIRDCEAPSAVTFRDLWMSYPGKRSGEPVHVLERINVDVRRGEFICFVGPSGCGKSTLLNIVGRSLRPTQGEVVIEGEPVHGPDRVPVIFQNRP